MSAIELRNLTLRRGDRTTLSDVNAVIGEGEFIGVFGPNGAGKTTLLRAILGLLRPAVGEIRVFGQLPLNGSSIIGYLPQRSATVTNLKLQGWDFVASAYNGHRWGLPILGAAGKKAVSAALEIVEAEELASRPVSEISGGELQRLRLAQSLLGQPRLLLLDEPLISLDPHYQRSVVDVVKRIQRTLGITVLFTAHEINPLLGAMDRVLYLGHGRAVLGEVDEVMTSDVLSRLYGSSIEVLHVKNRIIVVASNGEFDSDAHRHDA